MVPPDFSVLAILFFVNHFLMDVVWALFLFAAYPFGLRMYFLTTRSHGPEVGQVVDNVCRLYTISTLSTLRNDRPIPAGIVWGARFWDAPFILRLQYFAKGWLNDGVEHVRLWIFCSPATMKRLRAVPTMSDDAKASAKAVGQKKLSAEDTPVYSVMVRENPMYRSGEYYKLPVCSPQFLDMQLPACQNQRAAVDRILEAWRSLVSRRYRTLVVLISGPRGAGKSMVGDLLAAQLHGIVCHEYNPISPGNMMSKLFRASGATSNQPLIVVVDEYDTILNKLHANEIKEEKPVRTEVIDKISHNAWLDKIDRAVGIQDTIVLLTANSSFAAMEELDPAYTRLGRIHMKIELNDKVDSLMHAAYELRMGAGDKKRV